MRVRSHDKRSHECALLLAFRGNLDLSPAGRVPLDAWRVPLIASDHRGSTAGYPGSASDRRGSTLGYPGSTSDHRGNTSGYPGSTLDHRGSTLGHSDTLDRRDSLMGIAGIGSQQLPQPSLPPPTREV